MDTALKELINYGALGVVLAAVLGVTLWQHKVLFGSVIEQQKKFGEYMEALTRTLVGIRENCQFCRTDSLACLRDVEGHIVTKIEQVVAAGHDRTFAEMEKLFGGAVEKIEASNRGLIQAEKERRLEAEVEELSRPHNTGAVPHSVRG